VLTARVLRPDLFIIARVESEEAENRLRRAGADRVISPYQIGATHMVQTALRPAVVTSSSWPPSGTWTFDGAGAGEQSSTYVGKNLMEAGLRQKFGVIVVAIKHAGVMEFNPAPETVIGTVT
jgi:voltage-gated potassium channel